MSSSILNAPASPAASLVSVDGKTYPLESARIAARAEGGIALTTLAQTYSNPHEETLEVVYTLPLPADGAVLGYTIRIGEKVIRSEVQPREKASAAYRDAMFTGRTAGLLEQTRLDTFQQRLGNVPPHARVEIEIDVLHPLAFLTPLAGGEIRRPTTASGPDAARTARERAPEWEYRFPTVVGVRYHGAPGRVPDQGDLSPDRGAAGDIPTRVELSLTIADAGQGLVHSPSHAIEQASGESGARVRFKDGARLDRDVVVRWNATTAGMGLRVVEGKGLPGDDGRYALITLVPPVAPKAAFHRDLTVLVDASGSMTGEPLALARQVVGELLQSLEEGDRFELLAFSDDVRRLTHGLTHWSEDSLRATLDALAGLQAHGGTEMLRAVEEALKPLRDDAQRQVVLVTDGEIGFEAEVVGRIVDHGRTRLHVVGVGSAPNRALTQPAAAAGRGLELLAGDARSASEAARRLIAGTARPVLTDIKLGGRAVVGERLTRLRDVFAGQPLAFTAELNGQGGALELEGRLAGAGQPWTERIEIPAADAANALATTPLPIGALHGRSVIAELEIGLASRPGSEQREKRIEALGMRHQIASRRTSLVAIAEEPGVDPRAPRRRERLAVEVPAGVSAEGSGLLTQTYGRIVMARRMPTMSMFSLSRIMEGEASTRIAGDRKVGEQAGRLEAWFGSTLQAIVVEDIHWPELDLLVIELRVPYDGFCLPMDRLRILLHHPDGPPEVASARVVKEASSSPGPHEAGMIVRLAVRIAPGAEWPPGETVLIEWKGEAHGPDGHRLELDGRVVVRIPSTSDLPPGLGNP
jgi:Ca-activated chloride channel family protein